MENAEVKVGDKLWQAEATPEEVKQAIAADLIAGEKPIDIANARNVSLSTISRVKKKYLSPEMLSKMEAAKADILGDLMILSLESGIEATVRIAEVTKDRGWLTTQTAGDLGKMYGIISDKTVRVAEAMEDLSHRKTQDLTGDDEPIN